MVIHHIILPVLTSYIAWWEVYSLGQFHGISEGLYDPQEKKTRYLPSYYTLFRLSKVINYFCQCIRNFR
jgi:hypothetical protein